MSYDDDFSDATTLLVSHPSESAGSVKPPLSLKDDRLGDSSQSMDHDPTDKSIPLLAVFSPSFEHFTTTCIIDVTKDLLAQSSHSRSILDIVIHSQELREQGKLSRLKQYDRQRLMDAADYLHALLSEDQAFDMYATLLKFEQRHAPPPFDEVLSPLLIACARSARSTSQCQFVQQALSKRLAQSDGNSMSPLECFLAHMLMVETYALQRNAEEVSKHLKAARSCTRSFRKLSEPLLGTPRDKLLYIYHKRYLLRNLETKKLGIETAFDNAAVISDADFVRFVAAVFPCSRLDDSSVSASHQYGSPAPSSLSHIQYYLRLCCRALASSSKIRFPGFCRAMTAQSDWKYLRWAETIALFAHVWSEWQRCSCLTPEDLFWTKYVEDRHRISATETLSIFCEMINLATPWKVSTSDSALLQRFIEGVTTLLGLSDQDLETRFLQLWYARAFRAPGGEQYSAFPGSLPKFISEPNQDKEDNMFAAPESKEDVGTGPAPHGSSRTASSWSAQGIHATLAPSCRSSNSSFQRLRDTARSIWSQLRTSVQPSDDPASWMSARARNTLSSSQFSQLSGIAGTPWSLQRISQPSQRIAIRSVDNCESLNAGAYEETWV
ncbi:hypothetical protein BX600DRAFT_476548 [Xylariales sp. PMI_506]|nr:hypothetical protein BX600DRAFT_476548 [Xylariales sp. PMI_506]